jgi:dTDP-4-dehydrorhamnose 3,5-epimerase
MFDLKQGKISGCYELQPKIFEDTRGRFVKVFHEEAFSAHGLESNFCEEFYSVSHKNVIRGLHFQLPPMDGVKVVYCVEGDIFDVVVDLRVGSPTYGQYDLFEISSTKANIVYIPKGVAHGFCVLGECATLVYKVSSLYSPMHDSGVLWNSLGIPWPIKDVVLSDRDSTFPSIDQFVSPFIYEEK